MKRVIALPLVIAALTFGLVGAANAVCLQTGTLSRVTTTPGATATTIYVVNSFPSLIVWSATTVDAKIAGMAAAAAATHGTVQLTGDAVSCPLVGNPRAMGAVTVFTLE